MAAPHVSCARRSTRIHDPHPGPMPTTFSGGRAAAMLLLLAACGGGDAASDRAEAPTAGDTGSLTVAEAPAAVLDSAEQAAARGDTAAARDLSGAPAAAPGTPPPARPVPQGPVNAQAVGEYRLSMERIRQLARAGEQLAELQERRPDLRDSMAVASPDPNAIYERLNAVAPAREAIARAGMTPRDYALATTALLQAAMAHEMRRQGMATPPTANEANVRFMEENWTEIQQLMQQVAQSRQRP